MKNISLLPNKIIRQPLLSLNKYNQIPEKEKELNSFIDSLFFNKEFSEAVYLSSPSLYKEWEKVVKKEKERGKINEAILKYFLRSVSNTVPFGLFTSYTTLSSNSSLDNEKKYKRYSSIDLEYLLNLLNHLNQYPIIIQTVKYRRNNTIYKIGDKYRYIEPKFSKGNISYTLSSIDSDELIDYLVSHENDTMTFEELKNMILNLVDGVEEEEVTAYLLDLINSKIYISSFEATLNEEDLLNQVINFYKENSSKIDTDEELKKIFSSLIKVKEKLIELDKKVFNSIDIYNEIFKDLRKIGVDFKEKFVINSNLKKIPKSINDTENIDIKLNKLMSVLSKVSKKNIKEDSNLTVFKRSFYNRYEDKEVALVEALDNELGIGYLPHLKEEVIFSDLIDDVTMPQVRKVTSERKVETKVHNFWLNLLLRNPEKKEINLAKEDLTIFKEENEAKNGAFSISYSYTKDKIYLKHIGGTTGTNLIGRFSNSDTEVQEIINYVTDFEKSLLKNKIVAEVIHLPNNRAGNILIRKVNRDAEISIISKASGNTKVIDVNDLYISLKRNRIVLRSKKENKEVVPFLSSAQNYHYNSLPIYHFLCDLQSQDRHNDYSINFGGFNIGDLEYCPRLTYGEDVILRKATWLLKKDNNKGIESLKADLIKKSVPRYIYITSGGEDKMIIDIENYNTLNILYQEIEKNKILRVTECIYDMHNNETPESYANEYIGVVKSQKELNIFKNISTTHKIENNNVKRTFIYGDEWVYFKLYTGRITSDQLLIENISRIATKLKESGIIDKWFFIRFTDPDFHLRLRFHLKNEKNYSEMSKIIHNELSHLLEEQKIWKLDLSTYNRELERYYWQNIESSETIFHIDSEYTVNMLKYLKDNGESRRWLFILKSIDDFFNVFDISLVKRHQIINTMFNSFWVEYGKVKTIKKDVNNKFRKYVKDINSILNIPEIEVKNIYKERYLALKEVQLSIEAKENLDDLLWSYIHMHVNRFVQANPRFHELIMYGILERYYNQEIGKRKYNQKQVENEAY